MRNATLGSTPPATRSRTASAEPDEPDRGLSSGDAGPPTKRQRLSEARVRRNRRTVLACDVCRTRRTKCDGEQPACSYCRDTGNECTYRPIREPPPSRLETEISTIREKLEHIEGLLSRGVSTVVVETVSTAGSASQQQEQEQEQQQNHVPRALSSSHSSQGHGRNDQEASALDIPVMVIKDSGFLNLLGINNGEDLANSLVAAERMAGQSSLQQRPRMLVLQQQRALEALETYYEKVHVWFPILHPRFREQYLSVIGGSLPPTADSCLVLIVTAIGCLPGASVLSSSSSIFGRLDLSYANAALEMLPVVLIECSITAVQCLLAVSLYYCCTVQPVQAYDYVLIASLKIQTFLKSQMHTESPEDMELALRAYWAILIIEQELSNQIDLPSSRIWDLDDTTPLPSSYLASWPQPSPSQPTGTSPSNFDSPGLVRRLSSSNYGPPPMVPLSGSPGECSLQSPPGITSPGNNITGTADSHYIRSASIVAAPSHDEIEFFYLAEIAMRRMLHRCTTSTRRHPATRMPMYAPLVATELVYQLEKWHGHLPACLRFDTAKSTDSAPSVFSDSSTSSSNPTLSPLAEFLKTQYYSCKTSIYWPAAFQATRDGSEFENEVITTGDLDADVQMGVTLFFESYVRFMASVTVSVRYCWPHTWILYSSIFALTMGAWFTTRSLSSSYAPSLLTDALSPMTARVHQRRLSRPLPYDESKIQHCFNLSLQVFDGIAGVSPSLDRMGHILREKLQETTSQDTGQWQ